MAIALCVFGCLIIKNDGISAMAADAPITIKVKTDKSTMDKGDNIELTLTITSSVSGKWENFNLYLAPLDGEDLADATTAKYFKMIKAEWDEDTIDPFDYNMDDADRFSSGQGIFLSLSNSLDPRTDMEYYVDASEPIVIKLTIGMSDSYTGSESVGNVRFGIGKSPSNLVSIRNGTSATTYRAFVTGSDPTVVMEEYASVFVGSVSSDATLKSVKTGFGTASTEVTSIEDTMTVKVDGATLTDYKVSVEPNHEKAKVYYEVGGTASKTSSPAASGADLPITLSSTGTTTVSFYVVAEDEMINPDNPTTHTYTLEIKSSYARLDMSQTTVESDSATLKDPANSSLPGFGITQKESGTELDQVVTVPGDSESFTITPKVLEGYGASGTVTASSDDYDVQVGSDGKITVKSKTSGDKVSGGGKITVTLTSASGDEVSYTFDVTTVSVDIDIKTFTMTEGTSTINSESDKGSDYYFKLLNEATNFTGKFNITANATDSKIQVKAGSGSYDTGSDGTYTDSSDTRTAGSYTVKVTAKAGNFKEYSVEVAADVKAAEVKNLQYQAQGGSLTNVTLGSPESDGSYLIKVSLDGTFIGKQFTIKGDLPYGIDNLALSSNLSGTPAAGNKPAAGAATWTYNSLNHGVNSGISIEVSNTINGTLHKSVYKFEIEVYENKNGITNVTVAAVGGTLTDPMSPATFREEDTKYTLNHVNYAISALNFTITTNGTYAIVCVEVGGTADKVKLSTDSTTTISKQITVGMTTTVKIYAYSDGIEDVAHRGEVYEFNVFKDLPDDDSSLSMLAVEIDGNKCSFTDTSTGDFVDGVKDYHVEFSVTGSSTTAKVIIYAKTGSPKATVKCDGANMTAVSSGSYNGYYSITLNFQHTLGAETDKTYTLVVTAAEGGGTDTYTINVKKVIPDPKFTGTGIRFGNSGTFDDFETNGGYADGSDAYKFEETYNISEVKVGTRFYFNGTPSNEAAVTFSDGVKKDSSGWYYELAFGENTFSIEISAKDSTITYNFIITLVEDDNEITKIEIMDASGKVIATELFEFKPDKTNYGTITVPYTGYAFITITVTIKGTYTILYYNDELQTSVTNKKPFELKVDPLNAKDPIDFEFYAVADSGNGAEGEHYSFTIFRDERNEDTQLDTLVVTIGTDIVIVSSPTDYTDPYLEYEINIETTGNDPQISFVASPMNETATLQFLVESSLSTYPIMMGANGTSGNYVAMTSGVAMVKTFKFFPNNYYVAYKIKVTTVDGVEDVYEIRIIRNVPKGELTGLQVSPDGKDETYEPCFDGFEETDPDPNKYTMTLTIGYDIAVMPLNSKIYFKETHTADSTVTVTGATSKSGAYELTLSKFGLNTFTFTAKTGNSPDLTTTYVVNVYLYENIDDITQITIVDEYGKTIGTYGSATSYDIDVPYGATSVTVKVEFAGAHNYLYSSHTTSPFTKSPAEFKFNLKDGDYKLVLYGIANDGKGWFESGYNADRTGSEYTFNFVEGPPNSDASLDSLTVTVDGKKYEFKGSDLDGDIQIEYPGTKSSAGVSFTATPTEGTSTVEITDEDGKKITSSATFNIEDKSTTYTITVTAQDGTTREYTVTVKIPESDFTAFEYQDAGANTYKDVFKQTSSGYNKDSKTYTVVYDLSKVSVGATVRVRLTTTPGAEIIAEASTGEDFSVNGNVYAIKLVHGENVFTFTADGNGSNTYTVVVKLYENKNTITDIALKTTPTTSIKFTFDPYLYDYELTVGTAVTSVTITVTTDAKYATVEEGFKQANEGSQTHTLSVSLTPGQTREIRIYAISDNDDASDALYTIRITKERDTTSGPDVTMTIGDDFNAEISTSSDEELVYVLGIYSYDLDKFELDVSFAYGGTYNVLRVISEDRTSSIFSNVSSNTTKKIPLNFGSNVFLIEFNTNDGYKKTAVVIAEREYPYFEEMSAPEVPALKRDYDYTRDSYSYSVDSDVSTFTLSVDYDKSLFRCDIDGPSKLDYGANTFVVRLYEKSTGKASAEALRTVTISIYREQQDNSFWMILAGILIALVVLLIIIIIIIKNKNNNNNNDQPEVIIANATPAMTMPVQQPQQPTIIIQNPPDHYGY